MQSVNRDPRRVLDKNNSLCIAIAVIYVLTSIWAIASKLINAFISNYVATDKLSSMVMAYSSANLVLKSVFSLALGILLLICASSAVGKNKAAFICGAIGELITPIFNTAAYTLLTPVGLLRILTIIVIPSGIILIAVMAILLCANRDNISSIRGAGAVTAVFMMISAISNAVSCFASYMLLISEDINPFVRMLSISGTANTLLTIITGVLLALCFSLIYTTKEFKESVVD